ncbi:MAG: bifunctional oligoribonuclease/PAP phosphatase NrnA [Thermodesulfobacteriota bacterium]
MKDDEKHHVIKEVADKIREGHSFLVASHVNPEGDAIGSALAMAQGLKDLGKDVTVFFEDQIPEIYRFLPFSGEVIHRFDREHSYDVSVIVDCGDLDRVGDKFKSLQHKGVVLNIDHHYANSRFGDVNLIDGEASSTGEIVYEVLSSLSVEITADIAKNIYVSIMTDTGSFRYSSSTARAFFIASEMVKAGVKPWEVAQSVYESYPEKKLKLLGEVLQTLEISNNGRIASVYVTQEMMRRLGATKDLIDGYVNYPRSIAGVDVAFLLSEVSSDTPLKGTGKYKVSFRSKGLINVAEIAAELGGGGHPNASGCAVEGTLDEVKNIIKDLVEEKMKEKNL